MLSLVQFEGMFPARFSDLLLRRGSPWSLATIWHSLPGCVDWSVGDCNMCYTFTLRM